MATTTTQPPTVEAPTYKPGLATASSYQATPYKVEPQGLVQRHLKNVIQEDSPLMQQAARIATQKANARGLVNSSMAVGAAHDAVIGQAMPVAQADAATYDRAMTNTANQQNAASQFNTNAQNQVALSNQAATNEALKSTQQGTIALTDRQMTNDLNLAMATLDADTKLQLTSMDSRTKSLLQSNQSASNAYVQTAQNINQIQNNKELSGISKQRAIENQMALLREQLRQIGAQDQAVSRSVAYPDELVSLNIGNYFDPDFTLPSLGGKTGYDTALADYQYQRDQSWKAWDQGGRSGPWNEPTTPKPNPVEYGLPPAPTPTPVSVIPPSTRLPVGQPAVTQPVINPTWRQFG